MEKVPNRPQSKEVAGIRRGEIYLVSFDPTVGHEIKKTRPALVIQNDVGNRYSPLTIVAAITSKISSVPYPVDLRLVKRLGQAEVGTMEKVNRAIKISLGLVDL